MDKQQGFTVQHGDYIQYPLTNYNGKEYEKEKYIYVCVYIYVKWNYFAVPRN